MASISSTSTSDVNMSINFSYYNQNDPLLEEFLINNFEPKPQENIAEDIRGWAQSFGINNKSLSALLTILHKHGHPNLPKDGRTLMQTPQNVGRLIIDVAPGRYVSKIII